MTNTLYNEAIVALARGRAGAGRLEAPAASATCDNPLCGDRITLDLATAGGRITALAHKTRGCLLTEAAAAAIATHATELDPALTGRLLEQVCAFLDGKGEPPLPELASFLPVRSVRSRHECVLLPFQALDAAAKETGQDG